MSEADFAAALAAKVAPPEGTTTEQEEPEVEAPEAEAEATEPEAEETEAEVEATETERPEWLPENFKTVEAYVDSLKHKVEKFDQQANELGDLRKLVQETLAEPAPEQQPQQYGSIREAIDDNPEQVAYWAIQQQNKQVFDAAMAAWQQQAIEEGDYASLSRRDNLRDEIVAQRIRYEVSQEVMPSVQAVREDANTRALVGAKRELSQRYQDFDQVMQAAGEDATLTEGLDAQLLDNLRQTNPKAALELVYATASARQRVVQAAAQTQNNEAALERKRKATVASSSSAPAERKKDAKELLKEFFDTPEPHSVHHGLTRD